MPSTDRLLWLLQMALFLCIPVLTVVNLVDSLMNDLGDCGGFIYTGPGGQEYTLQPDDRAYDWCRGPRASLLSASLDCLVSFLWFAGLGAVIFCLRRIGKAMGTE